MQCWLEGRKARSRTLRLCLHHKDRHRLKCPCGRQLVTTQLPVATGHTDGLRFWTLAPLVPPPSSNESGSTASLSSRAAPKRQKRTFWTVDTYMKIYNELTAGRSLSAQLGAPAQSDAPFGELDRSTQPLLPIHSAVLDNMKTMKNIIKQHEREAT